MSELTPIQRMERFWRHVAENYRILEERILPLFSAPEVLRDVRIRLLDNAWQLELAHEQVQREKELGPAPSPSDTLRQQLDALGPILRDFTTEFTNSLLGKKPDKKLSEEERQGLVRALKDLSEKKPDPGPDDTSEGPLRGPQ